MYWTRCNLHRAALASKVLPDNLKNVLDISVKIVNHVKSRLLQCHYLLEVLCKDMEIRWLSWGKVLTRLVEFCEVVAVVLNKIDAILAERSANESRWLSCSFESSVFIQIIILLPNFEVNFSYPVFLHLKVTTIEVNIDAVIKAI
ncbi:Zinc finger BED domain-containing protein 5 [Trichinella pseudospiralis]|uniref:Zinc finger BED domain-containing protein 5 n=1 Tax=Trichinella pseudospiralis TaxID=6337 RepID=A0A0V1JHE2_TRIPS|nr:Zinc finger BED domain-containing protein 5 [Trichinella pseudospiralis]